MVDWIKRGWKLLGTFTWGYGVAWSTVFGIDSIEDLNLSWYTIFVFPALIGLGWVWPQLAKVFFELANTRKTR